MPESGKQIWWALHLNNLPIQNKEFNNVLGLDRLRIIHFNDSKKDFASRVDRHEYIGKGYIGKEPFGFFLNDKRLAEIPIILETPKESADDDIVNLRILRSLIKTKKGKRWKSV